MTRNRQAGRRAAAHARSALAALAFSLAAAAPAFADPPVWRVQGAHAVITLIPTTQVAPADGRWKTPAIRQAAAGAQELWFINPFGLPGPFTMVRLLATINTRGYLPQGQHLGPLLSPDGRERLARVAGRYGVDPAKLDRMQPWYAFVSLSIAAGKKSGAAKGLPIEQYVLATAPADAPRRGFDNLDDDMKLLVATPQAEQVYDLETFLKQADDPSINRAYAAAWAAGDLGAVARDRETRLRAAAPVTYQTMQVQPRRRWSDQIARLAGGDKPAVVMLDAANFVGPNGLPAMLRAKGLKVDGP